MNITYQFSRTGISDIDIIEYFVLRPKLGNLEKRLKKRMKKKYLGKRKIYLIFKQIFCSIGIEPAWCTGGSFRFYSCTAVITV